MGFKGVDKNYLQKLYIIVKNWEYLNNKNLCIKQIFEIDYTSKYGKTFLEKIISYNTHFFKEQIFNIKKTLSLIDINEDSEIILNLRKKQIYYAFNWCKQYKCKINYDSEYLSKSTNNKHSLPVKHTILNKHY